MGREMKMGRETKSGREKMMGRDKFILNIVFVNLSLLYLILSLSRMDAHFRVLLDVRKKKKKIVNNYLKYSPIK